MKGYYIKEDKAKEIKRKYKQKWFADEMGLSTPYISLVLTGNKGCPKRIAYCIVKLIDSESEIEEYFDFREE